MEKKGLDSIGDEIKKAIDSIDWNGMERQLGSAVDEMVQDTKRAFQQGRDSVKQQYGQQKQAYSQWESGTQQRQAYQRQNTQRQYGQATQAQNNRVYIPFKAQGSVAGNLMQVFGWIGAVLVGIPLLIFIIVLAPSDTDFVFGHLFWSAQNGLVIGFGTPFLLFVCMIILGRKKAKLYKRSFQFLGFLQETGYCTVESVATRLGEKESVLREQFRTMLQQGVFMQGAMNKEETYMFGNRESYEMYMQAQNQYEQRCQEQKVEPEQKENADVEATYIRELQLATNETTDLEFSQKLQKLVTVVEQIFAHVKEHPEKQENITRFMDYYLPTTMKLVKTFRQLEAQPVQGENIRKTREEINDSMDNIILAYGKLLNSLYEEVNLDVSSDISVMNTMFANEGLQKGDFETEQQESTGGVNLSK